MSDKRTDLKRLCERFGIAISYDDIWGKKHKVSDAGLRALLAEFEANAATPEQALEVERTARARRWLSPIEPVIAIAEGASGWRTKIRLPEAASEIRWRIAEEDGTIHEATVALAGVAITRRESIGAVPYVERDLEFGLALPPGYHRLALLEGDRAFAEALVISAPERCYCPDALANGARVWGPAIQLYALRSEQNWGIGDFSDLARLVEDWSDLGAGIVGLNPLHALFPHEPNHASPYSPSSRERLNVLYLDVEAIQDFRDCLPAQHRVRSGEFQARLARLREAPLVDYPGVAAAKFEVLELLYAFFREHHLANDSPRAREFREYQSRGGIMQRRHALFESLQAHFHAVGPSVWGWDSWPKEFQDLDDEATERLAAERLERVEYFEYLQWQAERQLARAGERCAARAMALGLYLDLAVSVDRGGSDTWTNPHGFALGASVGAPPDEFNPNGQDWGLPPLRPDRLRADGYAPLRRALAENMRQAGALRIDHVMGLMRLYWISRSAGARDGSYVHYAFDELLAIVALESHRNRCVVIGEDLGTVADEIREGLAGIGVLSYRLLYFERERDGGFKPSQGYPRDALVAVSTHDLATLSGWWEGRDLRLRRELGLFPDDAIYEEQLVGRAQERVRLMLALQHAGLLPADIVVDPAGTQALTASLAEAVHAFVASSPSRVMMVQLEDALGVVEQANMPGTTNEHPNWCRKLPETLEQLRGNDRIAALGKRLAAIRPHPRRAPSPDAAVARIPT